MTSVESLYLWKQWDQLLHIFLLLSYWFLFKLFSRERSRCSENSACGGSLHLNLDQFSCDHCYCWLLICSVLKQPYPNRNHCSGYIHCGFGQGLCKIKKKSACSTKLGGNPCPWHCWDYVKNHVCQSQQDSSRSSQAGAVKPTPMGTIHSLASLAKPLSHTWLGVSYSLLDHPAEDTVLRSYFKFSVTC